MMASSVVIRTGRTGRLRAAAGRSGYLVKVRRSRAGMAHGDRAVDEGEHALPVSTCPRHKLVRPNQAKRIRVARCRLIDRIAWQG